MNPEDIVKIILYSAAATGAVIAASYYYLKSLKEQRAKEIITPPEPENPVPPPEPDIIEQITTFIQNYPILIIPFITTVSSVIIYISLKNNKGFIEFFSPQNKFNRYLLIVPVGGLLAMITHLLVPHKPTPITEIPKIIPAAPKIEPGNLEQVATFITEHSVLVGTVILGVITIIFFTRSKPKPPDDPTPPSSPENSRPSSPENSRPSSPENSRPSSPENSRPSSPENSRPSSPENSRPSSPENSRPASPENSRPASPENSRPASPENSRPASPENSRPASPENYPENPPGNPPLGGCLPESIVIKNRSTNLPWTLGRSRQRRLPLDNQPGPPRIRDERLRQLLYGQASPENPPGNPPQPEPSETTKTTQEFLSRNPAPRVAQPEPSETTKTTQEFLSRNPAPRVAQPEPSETTKTTQEFLSRNPAPRVAPRVAQPEPSETTKTTQEFLSRNKPIPAPRVAPRVAQPEPSETTKTTQEFLLRNPAPRVAPRVAQPEPSETTKTTQEFLSRNPAPRVAPRVAQPEPSETTKTTQEFLSRNKPRPEPGSRLPHPAPDETTKMTQEYLKDMEILESLKKPRPAPGSRLPHPAPGETTKMTQEYLKHLDDLESMRKSRPEPGSRLPHPAPDETTKTTQEHPNTRPKLDLESLPTFKELYGAELKVVDEKFRQQDPDAEEIIVDWDSRLKKISGNWRPDEIALPQDIERTTRQTEILVDYTDVRTQVINDPIIVGWFDLQDYDLTDCEKSNSESDREKGNEESDDENVFITFVVHPILSNINSIAITLLVVGLSIITYFFIKKEKEVPNNQVEDQNIEEDIYSALYVGTIELCGRKGSRLFGLFMVIFLYLVVLNVLGLMILAVTVKSQLATTFWFSITIFSSCIVIGLRNKLSEYFLMFWNRSVAIVMRLILLFVEVLSYMIRPLSYALRLFANLLSGHILLHLFAKIVNVFSLKKKISNIPIPIVLLSAFSVLETLIAGLQSFIPATLGQIWTFEVF